VTDSKYHQHLIKELARLKKERDAFILAHVYQKPEIQDIADFTGDSLKLAQEATSIDAKVIVLCGVLFMAETVAILNPDKIVLLPAGNAGCPLADAAAVEELRIKRSVYPDAAVVSYVNSSAKIKAESDICCTSSNAVEVVNALKEKQVIFIPDQNLGQFVASHTDKQIILWDGFCYVHHHNIKLKDIRKLQIEHPKAEVIVHPECQPKVTNIANYVGSSAQMAAYVFRSKCKEFIIGTEIGMTHKLKKENPDKFFYIPSLKVCCIDMKLIAIENIIFALQKMEPQITVPSQVAGEARKSLERMLNLSKR